MSLSYAPATTRAVLARFGTPIAARIDGERTEISPHELPGEVEWRVDVLRWHVEKTVLDLVFLPESERSAHLALATAALIAKDDLHPMEASAVIQSAGEMFKRLKLPMRVSSATAHEEMEAQFQRRWADLQGRYLAIVQSCSRGN